MWGSKCLPPCVASCWSVLCINPRGQDRMGRLNQVVRVGIMYKIYKKCCDYDWTLWVNNTSSNFVSVNKSNSSSVINRKFIKAPDDVGWHQTVVFCYFLRLSPVSREVFPVSRHTKSHYCYYLYVYCISFCSVYCVYSVHITLCFTVFCALG